MKNFKNIAVQILCIWFILGLTSCAAYVPGDNEKYGPKQNDKGNHKGGNKITINPNNPNNPQSTNPGQSNDKPNNKFPQH